MKRLAEWTFATIGAFISIGGATIFWQSQSSSPGVSLWPMPALVLVEMALLGFAGLVAIALDGDERTPRWGIITWAVCGGLAALMIMGAWTIGPLLLPAGLAFVVAAVFAVRRRNRKILPDLGIFIVSATSNFVLLFLFVVTAGVLRQ